MPINAFMLDAIFARFPILCYKQQRRKTEIKRNNEK